MDERASLETRCKELEERNAQLERINDALMNRVEQDMDKQGTSFTLFQAAIALESKVKERTAALTHALHSLERTNRELKASNEAAQAASRAKSAFLAAMSHELRTPMNGVLGMMDLLLGTALTAQQHQWGETIRASAHTLLRILNDILDFSKIEADRMETEAAPFDLRTEADKVIQLLKPQIEAKGLDLRLDWPSDLPSAVIGDPTRFAQIVTNLLGNAVKFTHHGYVRLSARVEAVTDTTRLYRFEIEDSGIGIAEAVLPQLFENFFQADSSTTRRFGGTGLGLAIVRKLCRLMGGDCGATSCSGVGSTFWFTLEIKSASGDIPTVPVCHVDPAQEDQVAVHPIHILVVEDNPVNQMVATEFLISLGCTSELAENGRIAVERLTSPHPFDLVLMDCQMPEMDGFEATRTIRAHESAAQRPRVPIIALTANAMTSDRENCLHAGMDDFLSKPFQRKALSQLLAIWGGRNGTALPDITTPAHLH